MSPFLLGTTGEATSVPATERLRMVKSVVQAVGDSAILYAGIAGTSLRDIEETAIKYFDNGIKVFVLHLPYYYPLDDAQMMKFLSAVADRVPAPVMLYNMPSTTHMSLPLPILDELSQHENIIGVKDSERDLERQHASIEMWKDREDFSFFVGWGAVMAENMLRGADGIAPSVGNIVPDLCKELCDHAFAGNAAEANRVQDEMNAAAMIFQEGNTLGESLAALKYVMHTMDLCEPHVLPPLTRLTADEEANLAAKAKALIGN
jgi:4-hydroxy-tetrahydrodipicolinate synthase